MPDWPAFDDSAEALARLAAHYRLIIVSNVHRGFAASNQRLGGDFAAIITAEQVGAYKPADNHFRALDTTLADLGIPRSACCTSLRGCSTTMGPRTARARLGVDQPSRASTRVGRHAQADGAVRYGLEFASMADFADAVNAAFAGDSTPGR